MGNPAKIESGVRVCGAPGCTRMLADHQGTMTNVAGRIVKTCFGLCAKWAQGQRHS